MTFLQIILIIWDIPLFIFHISMITMLIYQKIKRNKDFEGGFYILVIIIGIVDIFAYIEVCLKKKRV
jgi:hypothetical protein